MKTFQYTNPVEIHFNTPFEKALESLKDDSILLVTSKGFTQRGLTKKIQDKLQGRLSFVVDSILPNPELAFLQDLKSNLKNNYVSILALGGGSVIDSAKFLSVQGEISINHKNLEIQKSTYFIPIYAIPTTAGTSSELTSWATIWDSDNGIKYSLQAKELYPKVAFYDSSLMLSLPLEITINTALDALSHAIESIWNKNANPISTALSLNTISLITEYLFPLTQNLNDLELREKITLASIYAGLAFSNTQTALAHAISYPLSMDFNIPHGLACSFSLPTLLACLHDSEVKEILLPFEKKINHLYNQLGISLLPQDYGLNADRIHHIFMNLNERAKNGLFCLEEVEEIFISLLQGESMQAVILAAGMGSRIDGKIDGFKDKPKGFLEPSGGGGQKI
ncbi:phosphonoacetaldehyde reductase [Helicobacter monodelphidis]|uniref:phosphonoacetaldehyde reductase n=1 Tax=Helicobacter sp. 15-1451 TaxID=2004995 RepID=UPI00215CC8BD|nr:phosphonoacetaldehyde reductase [Helicobacter sp. 15-1451]